MLKLRSRCIAVITLSVVTAVGVGCGESDSDNNSADQKQAADGKTYVIGTSVPFRPLTDRVDGEFVGAEKDLIAAIADAQGFKIKIENAAKFESLLPGMLSGRYDAAYDGFIDNPERHKQFKSVNWMQYLWTFAAPKGTEGGAALCGKNIVTLSGSQPMNDALRDYSKEVCPSDNPFKHVQLGTSQGPTAIKAGRGDAMIADSLTLPTTLEENPELEQVGEYWGEPALDALLVPARNAEFADNVVEGLKQIIADGTYDEILEKWDIPEASAYKEATVNVAQ